MPNNNPTRDRFDPPSNLSVDFEEYYFGDLEVDELFWQSNQPGDNIPWRKVNQTQAMNLRARSTHNFDLKTKVYQRI